MGGLELRKCPEKRHRPKTPVRHACRNKEEPEPRVLARRRKTATRNSRTEQAVMGQARMNPAIRSAGLLPIACFIDGDI
jgi:hypothetical protein